MRAAGDVLHQAIISQWDITKKVEKLLPAMLSGIEKPEPVEKLGILLGHGYWADFEAVMIICLYQPKELYVLVEKRYPAAIEGAAGPTWETLSGEVISRPGYSTHGNACLMRPAKSAYLDLVEAIEEAHLAGYLGHMPDVKMIYVDDIGEENRIDLVDITTGTPRQVTIASRHTKNLSMVEYEEYAELYPGRYDGHFIPAYYTGKIIKV